MSDGSYFKEYCPKCKMKNWFHISAYDGDSSKEDDSCLLECFNCHHKFLNPDALEFEDKEDLYKWNVDGWLWDEVKGNEAEFLNRCTNTNLGLEKNRLT
jgi:phage FluMu protein Com